MCGSEGLTVFQKPSANACWLLKLRTKFLVYTLSSHGGVESCSHDSSQNIKLPPWAGGCGSVAVLALHL